MTAGETRPTDLLAVRVPRPDEYPLLAQVEDEADTLFAQFGIQVPQLATDPDEFGEVHCLLAAGDPPVGLARVEVVDDLAYLDQIAVRPAEGRRGIGARLLEAAAAWAQREGYSAMTLTTFRDLPFNAPFYARHGFRVVDDLSPGLQAVRENEARLGLDAQGARVAMRRDLTSK